MLACLSETTGEVLKVDHHDPSPLLLTGRLNTELRFVALLAGHGEPAPIRVLNPLSRLAVEQALVHRLQLVDGQPVGRGASFIQPEVPRCHPLPVRTSRAQNKVP